MLRTSGASSNNDEDQSPEKPHSDGAQGAVDAGSTPLPAIEPLLPTARGDQVSRWLLGALPRAADVLQTRYLMADLVRLMAAQVVEPLILSGPSGAGKSQLAAAYARGLWAGEEIDVVMWVDATSRDAVLSRFSPTSTITGSARQHDAEDIAIQWWKWLENSGKRWLVVFDGLRDPADLDRLWPPVGANGQVLVTTRLPGLTAEGGDRLLRVNAFTPAESKAFLEARLATRPSQRNGAEGLAEALGHLPMSLAQAAAHIADRTALTCASYHRHWLDRHSMLFPQGADGIAPPRESRATVVTTVSLSIVLANSLNPIGLALPLLEMTSMMDPGGIPEAVLTTPAVLSALTAAAGREIDVHTVVDAVTCLHRLGLLTHDTGAPHRCVRVPAAVQETIRNAGDDEWRTGRARTMADALLQAWPNAERDVDLGAALRSNARALQTHAEDALWDPSAHSLLFRLGESAGGAGQVRGAIDFYGRLCDTATRLLGADHPDTLQARHNLAHWRGEAGDAEGMTAALEQVLADVERVLGEDHPSALATRHNLAYSQGEAGDPEGAVTALEEVLDVQRRLLGPDNTETLTTHLSYARWLGEAGDAQGAAEEFEQVLSVLELVLGLDHPETLTARHGLARWLGETGDVEGAVDELEQVLSDQHRVLGADNLDTLTTRHNLAYWRTELGDAAGAIEELDRVLAGQTRVLGPDHPDTLTTHHNLAYSRGELGAALDAATALEHVVAAQERVLGSDHPRTAISRQSLFHWRQKASEQAVE